MANPKQGKHQAELYADCLQEMHGQRPINRRDAETGRTDIREFKVNKDISGRAYQLEAIARVAENSVSSAANTIKKTCR